MQFSLPPASSSSSSTSTSPLHIEVKAPNGESDRLALDHNACPSQTFCARRSSACGHGQWTLRVDGGPELRIRLDGVGSLHFWAHLDGKLELRERQFLRVHGTANCQNK
jgi:hypothetical protein